MKRCSSGEMFKAVPARVGDFPRLCKWHGLRLAKNDLFQIVASSSKEEINSVPPPPSTSDTKDEEFKQKEPSEDGDEDTARKVSGR